MFLPTSIVLKSHRSLACARLLWDFNTIVLTYISGSKVHQTSFIGHFKTGV